MITKTDLEIEPLTSRIGSLVHGLDIARPLDADVVRALRAGVLERGVLFFRGQDMGAEELTLFMSHFAEPRPEPFPDETMKPLEPVKQADVRPTRYGTAIWHSDETWYPEPPVFTGLRAVRLPPAGGDTCWANMCDAYDALSEPIRTMIDGLTASHSMAESLRRLPELSASFASSAALHAAESVHPMVLVHPETRRKALYVNENGTTRIMELNAAESRAVLAMLFEHVKSPEFAVRWRWRPSDVALWDNRSVQHYAVADYDSERVMQTIRSVGETPIGPLPQR